MRDGALESQGSDKWYVTDGANSVGPVKLDLLVRGIEAGRVPLDSFIRHEAWRVWRPLTDFTDPIGDEKPSNGAASDLDEGEPDKLAPFSDAGAAPISIADSELISSPGSLPHAVTLSAVSISEAEVVHGPAFGPSSAAVPMVKGARVGAGSLIDFASAEGVPARASGSSVPPPVIAEAAEIVASWDEHDGIDEHDQSDPSLAGPSDTSEAEATPIAPGKNPAPLPGRITVSHKGPTDDISTPREDNGWGTARPADSSDSLPDDDLRGAADLSDAMLLLLSGAVKRTGADAALLHRLSGGSAKVVCAHGFPQADLLGRQTAAVDPVLRAASEGRMVLSEPTPGPIGVAILRRFATSVFSPPVTPSGRPISPSKPVGSALMLPIQMSDGLFGFIELVRSGSFSTREILKGEMLVLAFVREVHTRSFR